MKTSVIALSFLAFLLGIGLPNGCGGPLPALPPPDEDEIDTHPFSPTTEFLLDLNLT